MEPPICVVITGAGSGIGRALALAYAVPGTTLGLVGRNVAALQEVAARARERGANAQVCPADVTKRSELARVLAAFDSAHAVDLLIVNAGVSAPTCSDWPVETPEDSEIVVATNLLGALNSVNALLPAMRARRKGVIALVGSLSARFPIPASPVYRATKAAIEAYGASLRPIARREGIDVAVVSPGFVRSPMSARVRGPMPFLLDDEDAARIIKRGLTAGKGRIAFPAALSWGAWWLNLLPARLAERVVAGFGFHVETEP
jgi:short-subunit dehydrogenase